MIQYDMIQYDMIRYDVIQYGMIQCHKFSLFYLCAVCDNPRKVNSRQIIVPPTSSVLLTFFFVPPVMYFFVQLGLIATLLYWIFRIRNCFVTISTNG